MKKKKKKEKKEYKSYTQGDNGNWNPGVMIQQLCERYSWTSYGKKKKVQILYPRR